MSLILSFPNPIILYFQILFHTPHFIGFNPLHPTDLAIYPTVTIWLCNILPTEVPAISWAYRGIISSIDYSVQVKFKMICLQEHTHNPLEEALGNGLNPQWVEVHMHWTSQTSWDRLSYDVASNVHHIGWLKGSGGKPTKNRTKRERIKYRKGQCASQG